MSQWDAKIQAANFVTLQRFQYCVYIEYMCYYSTQCCVLCEIRMKQILGKMRISRQQQYFTVAFCIRVTCYGVKPIQDLEHEKSCRKHNVKRRINRSLKLGAKQFEQTFLICAQPPIDRIFFGLERETEVSVSQEAPMSLQYLHETKHKCPIRRKQQSHATVYQELPPCSQIICSCIVVSD